MAFLLSQTPGFIAQPAAALAAYVKLLGLQVPRIESNADFAALKCETEYGEYSHGDSIKPFQSIADGYTYSLPEILYGWELRSSIAALNGQPAAVGGLQQIQIFVDPASGGVELTEAYFVQGGNRNLTNDGLLSVWSHGVRGRGLLTLSPAPTFSYLADSAFAQGVPLTQSLLQQLNNNALFAALRLEVFTDAGTGTAWLPGATISTGDYGKPSIARANSCFYQCLEGGVTGPLEPIWPTWNGALVYDGTVLWVCISRGFTNGQTFAMPKSPVDGHQFTTSELVCILCSWLDTGAWSPTLGRGMGASGPGRIQRLQKSANSSGVISTAVTYWDGSNQTITNDGIVHCVAFFQRALSAYPSAPPAYYLMEGSEFMSGQLITDGNLEKLNDDVNNAAARPEAFYETGITNQQAPSVPTSPVTGAQFNRSECMQEWRLDDTGAIPAGVDKALRVIVVSMDPSTGQASLRVDYNKGGSELTTGNGSLDVALLAYKGAEIELAGISIIPTIGTPYPAPPGGANLVPNGGFFSWGPLDENLGGQYVGVPVAWSVSNITADGYTTRDDWNYPSGPNVCVGLHIGNNHAPANQQYVSLLSYPVAFQPGDTYKWSIDAIANPSITSGLIVRMHLRDVNFSNDVSFELVPVRSLGSSSPASFGFQMVMPQPGDTTVHTSAGIVNINASGVVPANVAYCYMEIWNDEPNVSSTIFFHNCQLEHLSAAPLAYQGAWSSSVSYSVGQEVTYQNCFWLAVASNTNSAPSTSNSNWVLEGSTALYLGAYDNGTSYTPGNEVTYQGNFYICILASTGNLPTNATYWQEIGGTTSRSYQGAWNSGTSYTEGQQVTYAGCFWLCLIANTNSPPSVSNSNWVLQGTSALYMGDYSASVSYVPSMQVTYQGAFYMCILATLNHVPTDATYWVLVGTTALAQTYQGAWSSSTTYQPGQEVTYQGSFWLCIVSNTNSAPSVTNSNWQLEGTSSMYRGAYSGGTTYVVGNEVTYNGYFYLCIAATTGNAPSDANHWILLGPTSPPLVLTGAWSASTSYQIGQSVTYNGAVWVCVIANLNSAPSTTNANWTLLGTAAVFLGAYSAGTAYVPGNEVTYNGLYYKCILATTGHDPSNATYWILMGSTQPESFVGAWSSIVAYKIGNEVTYQGCFWLCLVADTNSAPAVGNSNWQLCGTSTYFRDSWDPGTAYGFGDEVVYQGYLYICKYQPTPAGTLPTNTTYWSLVGPAQPTAEYMGAWSSTITYVPGDLVYSGNYWWVSMAPSTNAQPTGPPTWQLQGFLGYATGLPGNWNSGTNYSAGALVLYGGYLYLAIAPGTNHVPPNAAYWLAIAPVSQQGFVGNWDATVAYQPNMQVYYNYIIWLCLVANTNSAPAVGNSNWQPLTPVNMSGSTGIVPPDWPKRWGGPVGIKPHPVTLDQYVPAEWTSGGPATGTLSQATYAGDVEASYSAIVPSGGFLTLYHGDGSPGHGYQLYVSTVACGIGKWNGTSWSTLVSASGLAVGESQIALKLHRTGDMEIWANGVLICSAQDTTYTRNGPLYMWWYAVQSSLANLNVRAGLGEQPGRMLSSGARQLTPGIEPGAASAQATQTVATIQTFSGFAPVQIGTLTVTPAGGYVKLSASFAFWCDGVATFTVYRGDYSTGTLLGTIGLGPVADNALGSATLLAVDSNPGTNSVIYNLYAYRGTGSGGSIQNLNFIFENAKV